MTPLRTALCDLLGIELPILQGAMQGAGGPRLAAAVSEAGGLGVLPTFGGTEADLLRDIEETRKRTSRPFGVNIVPMGRAFTETRARICIEQRVPIVTTGRGDPGFPIVQSLRAAGIRVLPVVPSVEHALRVEAEGADAIIASGTEAGGHVGRVATLPLVPQIVDAVRVPVVAAGGIGDGRGLVAAFALGACGIQLGTRLIASVESEAPDGYKARVLAARETDTLVSDALTGKPVRTIATPALRAYDDALRRGASAAEIAELRRAARLAPRGGDREEYPAVAGQIAGMVREILPVQEILSGILREAAQVYRELGRAFEGAQAEGSSAWSRSGTSSD